MNTTSPQSHAGIHYAYYHEKYIIGWLASTDEPSPRTPTAPHSPTAHAARRRRLQSDSDWSSAMQSVFDEPRVQALEVILVALLQATVIPNEVEPRHLLRVL